MKGGGIFGGNWCRCLRREILPANRALGKGSDARQFEVGQRSSHVCLSDTQFNASLFELLSKGFQFPGISVDEGGWVRGVDVGGRRRGEVGMVIVVTGVVVRMVKGLHLMSGSS